MQLLKLLDDAGSRSAVLAERAFARALGGSCHSPVAALATLKRGRIHLTAEILSADGKEKMREEITFAAGHEEKAAELGRQMLERAPEAIRTLFAAA